MKIDWSNGNAYKLKWMEMKIIKTHTYNNNKK